MTHKYAETVTISAAAGVLQMYQWSCNGLYDPNISGVGHQPMFFDQMSPLYNHYTVIGSKIRIKVVPQAGPEDSFIASLFVADDTSVAYTQSTDIIENSKGTYRLVPGNTADSFTLSSKFSPKKVFGGALLNNTLLRGNSSTNPSEQSLYTFGVQGLNAASVSATLMVEIEYIAVWAEIKEIPAS